MVHIGLAGGIFIEVRELGRGEKYIDLGQFNLPKKGEVGVCWDH